MSVQEDIDVIKECLAIEDLRMEMHAVIDLLCEHVANEHGLPVCGAKKFDVDLLVKAALASDCDECRVKIGVALMGDKTGPTQNAVGQRSEPEYKPEPMENADEICASARKNRDGS